MHTALFAHYLLTSQWFPQPLRYLMQGSIDSDQAGTTVGTQAGTQSGGAAADDGGWSLLYWLDQPWSAQVGIALLVTILVVAGYLLLQRAVAGVCQRHVPLRCHQAFLQRLLRWLLLPLAALVIVQQTGINLTSVWGLIATALAMVAIGFVAVWSLLSNATAAALIMLSRLFRHGDDLELVEAGGAEGLRGIVTETNLLFTVIEQQAAEQPGSAPAIVKIPNNIFFQRILRLHPRQQPTAPTAPTAPDAGIART